MPLDGLMDKCDRTDYSKGERKKEMSVYARKSYEMKQLQISAPPTVLLYAHSMYPKYIRKPSYGRGLINDGGNIKPNPAEE